MVRIFSVELEFIFNLCIGNFFKFFVDNGDVEEYVEIYEVENSYMEWGSILSSEIDIVNIFKIVVLVNERSLNDVMFNDFSVLSLEISLLFMFELLGNIFFYDMFIVFFLICIKVFLDMILFFDFIVDFIMEGVNDLVVDVY